MLAAWLVTRQLTVSKGPFTTSACWVFHPTKPSLPPSPRAFFLFKGSTEEECTQGVTVAPSRTEGYQKKRDLLEKQTQLLFRTGLPRGPGSLLLVASVCRHNLSDSSTHSTLQPAPSPSCELFCQLPCPSLQGASRSCSEKLFCLGGDL